MADFLLPNTAKFTSFYGKRKHPITGEIGKMHWGVDFSGHTDDIIRASADGTVRIAKMMSGFGNAVFITHNIRGVVYETVYAHLSSFSVKPNQKVKQGQQVGLKGNTGSSTSKHLHFELTRNGNWENTYKNAVDPLLYIYIPETATLQTLLNKHGYKLTVDGIAGKSTTDAVIAFQKGHGLVADGIAGVTTLAKLTANNNLVADATPPKQPIQPIQPPKETIRIFNPSSNTLKQAVESEFAQAVKDKLIDNKWLVQFQQGKLSLDDALALRIIIEQRKNK